MLSITDLEKLWCRFLLFSKTGFDFYIVYPNMRLLAQASASNRCSGRSRLKALLDSTGLAPSVQPTFSSEVRCTPSHMIVPHLLASNCERWLWKEIRAAIQAQPCVSWLSDLYSSAHGYPWKVLFLYSVFRRYFAWCLCRGDCLFFQLQVLTWSLNCQAHTHLVRQP